MFVWRSNRRDSIKRGSSQRGMAVDVLALAIAIAGSLFFTSRLWSTYRQTLAVTNLEVGLSAIVPLRPQILIYNSYGVVVAEPDTVRVNRLDSLVSLLIGVPPAQVGADVPTDQVYTCLVQASSTPPPLGQPIALTFPYRSSNASPADCSQLDLSSLAGAAPSSLHIVIASSLQPTPVMVLEHPLIGRGANVLYRIFSTAALAVQDMSDVGGVGVNGNAV